MNAEQRRVAGDDRGRERGRRRGVAATTNSDRPRRRRRGGDVSKAAGSAPAEWPEAGADYRAVPGLHPVRELLRAHLGPQQTPSPRAICVAHRRRPNRVLADILALASQAGVPVWECTPSQLEGLAGGVSHQGVVAFAAPYRYLRLPELLEGVPPDETSLLVALDGVTDPNNLGSVARTAEAVGAHGLIVPARRAAGVGPAAEKAAAGAFSHLRVARVPNLARALGELADRRVWTVGLDADAATAVHDCDLLGEAVAIVVGAEGRGLSRLVASRCDVLAALEMRGRVGSLNASVAAAMTLYEALRRRRSP